MVPGAQWGGWAPLFLGALHRGAAPQVGLETGGSLAAHPPPKKLLSLAVLAAQTGGAAAAWTQKTPPFSLAVAKLETTCFCSAGA